jgi:hypothetical protein
LSVYARADSNVNEELEDNFELVREVIMGSHAEFIRKLDSDGLAVILDNERRAVTIIFVLSKQIVINCRPGAFERFQVVFLRSWLFILLFI